MAPIIQSTLSPVNTNSALAGYQRKPLDVVEQAESSHNSSHAFRALSRGERKMLKFYRDLRLQGIEESDYSLKELSVRLGLSPEYASTCASNLTRYGYLGGKHGGSENKLRWITYEGFSLVDNQHLSQILNQNQPIPYIDLSEKEKDKIKIIEDEQNCGQVDIEEELNQFLEKELVPPIEQKKIKKAIKTTPIGPIRRESLIRRVMRAAKKSFIGDKLAYFMKALQKECQDLKEFIQAIGKQNLIVNEYELTNLGEVGCFAI